MRLYHFTCSHRAEEIDRNGGIIVPHYHPYLGFAVVWMTFDPNASRDALGLSSTMLDCDRMNVRYTIENPATAVAWNTVRSRFKYAHLLEATPGTRPAVWYVSREAQRGTPADLG